MIFFNPACDHRFHPGSAGRDAMAFHKRLPGYRETPLHMLTALAHEMSVAQIYVKDESNRLGLPAFKVLGASWAAYSALRKQYPGLTDDWQDIGTFARQLRSCPSLTLYSATDGNHGRAVAHVARLFGLPARIYVPHGTVSARVKGIEQEGAQINVVDGTYDDTVAEAARAAEANGGLLIQDNGWSGYETIPHYIVGGYSTMMQEIDDALEHSGERQPTHVFVQIGNGSFADAVVRHYREKASPPVIIGVEPGSAACGLESARAGRRVRVPGPHSSIMVGMNCDTVSLVSWPVLQRGIDCFVSIPDERTRAAVKKLAELHIISGETGAAGIGALMEVCSEGREDDRKRLHIDGQSRVLVFSTEGITDPEMYRSIVSA